MGRPPKTCPANRIAAVALTGAEMEALDGAVVAARQVAPETAWTRSTLLRALILAHLRDGRVPAHPPEAV